MKADDEVLPASFCSVATTLLGLLLVTFVISRMLPADPVLAVVGDHASESTIAAARIRLGLDKPILVQFWIYISDVLQGDLGQSIRTGRPISEELMRVFPATLELATLGTIIGVIFGIPLGVWAAVRKDTYDRPLRALRRPDRLFGADLLARPDGPPGVLRQARLAAGARAPRFRL